MDEEGGMAVEMLVTGIPEFLGGMHEFCRIVKLGQNPEVFVLSRQCDSFPCAWACGKIPFTSAIATIGTNLKKRRKKKKNNPNDPT